jgi:hypothetical protein
MYIITNTMVETSTYHNERGASSLAAGDVMSPKNHCTGFGTEAHVLLLSDLADLARSLRRKTIDDGKTSMYLTLC